MPTARQFLGATPSQSQGAVCSILSKETEGARDQSADLLITCVISAITRYTTVNLDLQEAKGE